MHPRQHDSTPPGAGAPAKREAPAKRIDRRIQPCIVSAPHRRITPDAEFQKWVAKYGPVERAIMEERARRLASAEKRRTKRRLAFAAECEATEGLAKTMRRRGFPGGTRRSVKGASGQNAPLARIGNTNLHVLDGGIVSVLLSVVGVKCTREVDAMRHSLKRPLYYERENARRRALAAQRRKVRQRTTSNPCPTREEVLDAWIHAKDSREAMLRFGGILEDLECHVDNSLRFGAGGGIVGRAPGIKGWLQTNIPILYSKYTTVMRYKAAAKKLRQVVGIKDPTPLSMILRPAGPPPCLAGPGEGSAGMDGNKIILRTKSDPPDAGRKETGRGDAATDLAMLRARAVYLEAMEGVHDNATCTIARLDELLDPERVEDATMLETWKAKYENEITLRTKRKWVNRLFKRTG